MSIPAKISTSVITDLCIAINCVDGTDVDPKYVKQNMRVVKTLKSLLMFHAYTVLDLSDVRLHKSIIKRMNKAMKDAGWDCSFVLSSKGILKIVAE